MKTIPSIRIDCAHGQVMRTKITCGTCGEPLRVGRVELVLDSQLVRRTPFAQVTMTMSGPAVGFTYEGPAAVCHAPLRTTSEVPTRRSLWSWMQWLRPGWSTRP